MIYTEKYSSPLGTITLAGDGEALTGLWFEGQKYFGSTLPWEAVRGSCPVFLQARRWLNMYFNGERPNFTPPLRYAATPFREAVWEILLSVPYGKTVTYSQIARTLEERTGEHRAAQVVGGAVGRNPISLIIPCHRVVGAGGNMTGYAGGIKRKLRLLELERADTRGLYIPTDGPAL